MGKFTLVVAATTFTAMLAGCAHSTSQADTSASFAAGGNGRWTGVIRARSSGSGMATPSKPGAAYQGNVRMTRWENDTTRTSIYIRLSTPESNESVSWVLATGRCGAIEAPVLPVNGFDPLQVGSDGRAEATSHIPFTFPTGGSYHIDFFSGNAARLTDVVACATLQYRTN